MDEWRKSTEKRTGDGNGNVKLPQMKNKETLREMWPHEVVVMHSPILLCDDCVDICAMLPHSLKTINICKALIITGSYCHVVRRPL